MKLHEILLERGMGSSKAEVRLGHLVTTHLNKLSDADVTDVQITNQHKRLLMKQHSADKQAIEKIWDRALAGNKASRRQKRVSKV